MQPVIDLGLRVIAIALRTGVPTPVKGVATMEIPVEDVHALRYQGRWIGERNPIGVLVVFHALPAAVGISRFHEPSRSGRSATLSLAKGGGAIRSGHGNEGQVGGAVGSRDNLKVKL